MIAHLPMYERAETAAAHDLYWMRIREALGEGPAHLTRSDDLWTIWQSPDLLLSQTCGLPYRTDLMGKVTLVGTPNYGLSDLRPGYYCSVLVAHKARQGEPLSRFDGSRFAYNDVQSQSGWAAAHHAFVSAGITPNDFVKTGSHHGSAKAVAEERADLASLDLVSWMLMQRYDSFEQDLTVIARTTPTPGLPLISAKHRDATPIRRAIQDAISSLDHETRDILMLAGLQAIPDASYLALDLPPAPSPN